MSRSNRRTMSLRVLRRYQGERGEVKCWGRDCRKLLGVGREYVSRMRAPNSMTALYCLACAEELNII